MSSKGYGGATLLGHSKYAAVPPHMRRAQLTVPPAVSSSPSRPATNTIATREQIAATIDESAVTVTGGSGAELAVAQGNALKEEVDKHAASFSRKVSSAVSSTRQLLELIRAALKEDDATALKTVDDLWTELEQLFEAANGAKDALPDFLEKQRNNMALYHCSVMNETYRESQEELNMQHKKVNVQHGLILEQQEAFQNYKAQTAGKLKDLDELRERVSRLTLEKGNFKDELDKYVSMLEKEKSTKAEDFQNADALQKELETLATSKKQLLAEVDSLQKTISELQEKTQAAEQQITDRFTTELKTKTDLLAKESTKSTNLTNLINALKSQENNDKMAVEKLKAEKNSMTEKYNRMAAEHSQAFSKSKEQNQKVEALTADAECLRKETTTLTDRLAKLPGLEADNARLFQDKADLLEQVGKLTMELNQVKDSCVKVKKDIATLTEDLQDARSQNGNLQNEKQDLLSKQKKLEDDAKKATQAVTIFKNENATLKSTVDKLKANQAAPAVGGARLSSMTDQDKAALEQQIKGLEEQKVGLEKALEEWTALAKRSYKEYKDMLPTYKQAEQHKKAAADKDEQIKALKLELSSAKTSKPNGVSSGGDAAYWKGKYEKLMAQVSN